jgi:hypothetical protein
VIESTPRGLFVLVVVVGAAVAVVVVATVIVVVLRVDVFFDGNLS